MAIQLTKKSSPNQTALFLCLLHREKKDILRMVTFVELRCLPAQPALGRGKVETAFTSGLKRIRITYAVRMHRNQSAVRKGRSDGRYAAPRRSFHPVQVYTLHCDQAPVSARLGPPDYYPPSVHDPEWVLTRDSVIVGHKEAIEGLDESKEVSATLTGSQALWSKHSIARYRELVLSWTKPDQASSNGVAEGPKPGSWQVAGGSSQGGATVQGPDGLQIFRLQCDHEALSERLGCPDFFPPSPTDPELVLSKEAIINGYRGSIAAIDESKEVSATLTGSQALWGKGNINRYREVIRTRLRLLNNAQRKGRGLEDQAKAAEPVRSQVSPEMRQKVLALAPAVYPPVLRNNEARVAQALDKALLAGDVQAAESAAFDSDIIPTLENFLFSHHTHSAELIGLHLLLEWALCTSRNRWPQDPALTKPANPQLGGYDLSAMMLAVSVLKGRALGTYSMIGGKARGAKGGERVHELVVAWIEGREEVGGLEEEARLQVLMGELVQERLFFPVAYVAQLVADGTLQVLDSAEKIARASRHSRVLRQLPSIPQNTDSSDNELSREKGAALHYILKLRKRRKRQPSPKQNLQEAKAQVAEALGMPFLQRTRLSNKKPKQSRCCFGGVWLEVSIASSVDQASHKGPEPCICAAGNHWWLSKPEKEPSESYESGEATSSGESSREASSSSAGPSSSRTPDCPALGEQLKRLKFTDRKQLSTWLVNKVRSWVRGAEQGGELEGAVGEVVRWQLGEEELLGVVFVLDVVQDHAALGRLLIWLLAQVNTDKTLLSESAVVAALRRYEKTLAAMNAVPEILSTALGGLGLLEGARNKLPLMVDYINHLRQKYSHLPAVASWESSTRQQEPEKLLKLDALLSHPRAEQPPLVPPPDSKSLEQFRRSLVTKLSESLGFASLNLTKSSKDSLESRAQLAGALLCEDVKKQSNSGGGALFAAQGAVLDSAVKAMLQVSAHNSQIPGFKIQSLQKLLLKGHLLCLSSLRSSLGHQSLEHFNQGVIFTAKAAVLYALANPREQVPEPETPEVGEKEVSSKPTPLAPPQDPVTSPTTRALAAFSLVAYAVLASGWLSLQRVLDLLDLQGPINSLLKPPHASSIEITAALLWFRFLLGGGKVSEGFPTPPESMALAQEVRHLKLEPVLQLAFPLFVAAHSNLTPQQGLVKETVKDLMSFSNFQDLCLADTRALYTLLSSAPLCPQLADSKANASLDARAAELLPLNSRVFLHALSGGSCSREEGGKGVPALVESHKSEMLEILDSLQPATFHWQWLDLRLLLDEQVVLERLKAGAPAGAALAAVTDARGDTLRECEKSFTSVVLTRLLLRPRAAALYSEAVQALGRGLEDYLILQVKWVLEGVDMLQGRKPLRSVLENYAFRNKYTVQLSTIAASTAAWGPRRKPRPESLGEQAPFEIERGLADLVLPCLCRSPAETTSTFAAELVRQLEALEQYMSSAAQQGSKSQGRPSGGEPTSRPAARWGRSSSFTKESAPGSGAGDATVSAAGFQTSIWLRLQFLLPLLPQVHADKDTSERNMRLSLAPILVRLLASQAVQEAPSGAPDAVHLAATAATQQAGDTLFGRLLSVLHVLLISSWAGWLEPPLGKGTAKMLQEEGPFDKEAVERVRVELERLELPSNVQSRIEIAIPGASSSLVLGSGLATAAMKSPCSPGVATPVTSMWFTGSPTRVNSMAGPDAETEMDLWTLLEEGSAGPASAANWLAGAD